MAIWPIADRAVFAMPVILALIAGGVLVGVAPRAVPVAARLIAVRIPVLGGGAILDDLRADVVEHFPANLLVLSEFLAFAASAFSHGSLPEVGACCDHNEPRCFRRTNSWACSISAAGSISLRVLAWMNRFS